MDEAHSGDRSPTEPADEDDEPRRTVQPTVRSPLDARRSSSAAAKPPQPGPIASSTRLAAPALLGLVPGAAAQEMASGALPVLDGGAGLANGLALLPPGPWPTILIVAGLLIALLTGIAAHAVTQFSPARLLQKLERRFADREELDSWLDEVGEELDRSEDHLPALWLLQLCGLGLAVYGVVATPEHPFWPSGIPGFVLLFFVAALFSAYLPDRLARTRAEGIVWRSLPILRALHWLLWPLTRPLVLLSLFLVRNLLGLRAQDENGSDNEDLADEIRAAVEDKDEHESLADEAKDWIENIVEFKDEDVAGVMTPRTDIIGIPATKSFREAVRLAVEAGHSRLPVFEETLDRIVGMFYLRDAVRVLAFEDGELLDEPVSSHVREAYFVPESKAIGDLFREFKLRRLHIAIVVDEYGGTSGIVSLEDVIEEIVGEIVDEYDEDEEQPALRVVEKGKTVEVDARLHVSDLNEELTTEVPESDDYETIGGWVFSHLGRIPEAGDSFETDQLEVTILAADPRKIERLRVRVLEREREKALP